MANRIKLYSIAFGLLLLTVVMVNIGAYQFLSQTHGNTVAAFLVAAANGVLAILLIYAGRQRPPGPEAEMVREIRDMALTELSADREIEFVKYRDVFKKPTNQSPSTLPRRTPKKVPDTFFRAAVSPFSPEKQ